MGHFIIEVAYDDKKSKRQCRYVDNDGKLTSAIGDARIYEYDHNGDFRDVYRVVYHWRGVMPHEWGAEMVNKNITGICFSGRKVT